MGVPSIYELITVKPKNMSDAAKNERDENGLFVNKPGPGRPKGARNRLTEDFMERYADAWSDYGEQALKTLAKKDPKAFVGFATALMPKNVTMEVENLPVMVLDYRGFGSSDSDSANYQGDVFDQDEDPFNENTVGALEHTPEATNITQLPDRQPASEELGGRLKDTRTQGVSVGVVDAVGPESLKDAEDDAVTNMIKRRRKL
jgi:hypothetical protein